MTDRSGQQLDTYRLLRLLGGGMFGDVYLAQDRRQRQVAIKLLHGEFDTKQLQKFLQEVNIGLLRHPHIVTVLGLGIDTTNNTPYIVMEYATQGTLLTKHPRGTPLPLETIISYVKQIAAALQSAHDEDIIHRDIKPENILVDQNGTVKVADFGISVISQSGRTSLEKPQQGRAGTPWYMAPEQIKGKPSRSSDQYALAIIIYEWLTGEPPFSGGIMEVYGQHLYATPDPLPKTIPMLSEELEAVLMKALSKEIRDRYPTVQEFAHALEAAYNKEVQRQTVDMIVLPDLATIGETIDEGVAKQFLADYLQAQGKGEFGVCEQIEKVMQRLLMNIVADAVHSPLLTTLYNAIVMKQHVWLQRATLTLLTMIAHDLLEAPERVFTTLIPPLLSLAGLPAVGAYHPDSAIAAASDLNIADLALTLLAAMGKRGPSGAMLTIVRNYFNAHPMQWEHLALYSLQVGTLITPTVVPLSYENYERYEQAVGRWISLRDSYQIQSITQQDIAICVAIHKELVASTEAVLYPTAVHILVMLQEAAAQPAQWRATWQHYLLAQLNNGRYSSYQEAALLWIMLFAEAKDQQSLADALLAHYNNNQPRTRRFVQRFIGYLSGDLRYLRHLRNLRHMGDLRYLGYLRYLGDLKHVGYLGDLRRLGDLRDLEYLRYLGDLRDLRYLRDLRDLKRKGDLGHLRELLLTEEVAHNALVRLVHNSRIDTVEQVELLTILLSRLLQINDAGEVGNVIEQEIERIVNTALGYLTAHATKEAVEINSVVLEIVSYLPLRSANEITNTLKLVEGSMDERVQNVCADALQHAWPKTNEAWAALEGGKGSKIGSVRKSVKAALKRRK